MIKNNNSLQSNVRMSTNYIFNMYLLESHPLISVLLVWKKYGYTFNLIGILDFVVISSDNCAPLSHLKILGQPYIIGGFPWSLAFCHLPDQFIPLTALFLTVHFLGDVISVVWLSVILFPYHSSSVFQVDSPGPIFPLPWKIWRYKQVVI